MVPPIDPGGWAMDVGRSAYRTMMDFGDGVPVEVCWYFVPDDTPALPFAGLFRSRNWETYREWLGEPGEIYLAPRPWRNGSRCRSLPRGVWIGTPEQWQYGITPGTPYVPIVAPGVPAGTAPNVAGAPYPRLGVRLGTSARTRSWPIPRVRAGLVMGSLAVTSSGPVVSGSAGMEMGSAAVMVAAGSANPEAGCITGVEATTAAGSHAAGSADLALAVAVVSTGYGRLVASAGLSIGASATTSEGRYVQGNPGIYLAESATTLSRGHSSGSSGIIAGAAGTESASAATAASGGLRAAAAARSRAAPSVSPHLPLTVGAGAAGHAPAAATSAAGMRTGAAVSSEAAAVGSGDARVSAGDIWQTNAHAVATGAPGIVLVASAATTVGHSVTVSAGIILDRVDSERENVVTFTCGTLNGAGTLQGTAAPIVSDTVLVTPTALNTGVILPAGCYRVVVWNLSATVPLLVYPPTGAKISTGATNAAFTVSTGAGIMFIEMSTTQWRVVVVS